MLRTRHGASQPVTPSAAYASEAEPPLLHITTLTTGSTKTDGRIELVFGMQASFNGQSTIYTLRHKDILVSTK